MTTQQEFDASDIHIYEGGNIEPTQALEAHSVVRFFTGPGRKEHIEVRTHRDGYIEVSAWGGLEIHPAATNLIRIRPVVQ